MQQATTSPIDALARDLLEEFHRNPRASGVVELLATYSRDHDDWRRYALFARECYSRNLIVRNEVFDLIVLCWNAGQASPIHNHEGQRCWMGVLEGDMEEAYFQVPDGGGAVTPGPVKPYRPGAVAYINDDIGLHVVRAAGGAPAVSLHLYSLPFDECNIYCPETGRVTRKKLEFHSIAGKLCR